MDLAVRLFEAGCVRFGEFRLKSGLISPIYLDLRLLVSDPSLLREAARALAEVARDLSFDRIGAVPLAGLPIGVALALEMDRPLIYPRPAKSHGTRRTVEGGFRAGERVLLVDDLITRGDSKLEAIRPLEEAGLVVENVLVLIDREQGGGDDLAHRGYRLHSLIRLTDLLDRLLEEGCITSEEYGVTR